MLRFYSINDIRLNYHYNKISISLLENNLIDCIENIENGGLPYGD